MYLSRDYNCNDLLGLVSLRRMIEASMGNSGYVGETNEEHTASATLCEFGAKKHRWGYHLATNKVVVCGKSEENEPRNNKTWLKNDT